MANQRAKRLRDNPTEAERRLWDRLRRRQIEGFRFRRQQPIGPYIVDFYCSDARLIVEVDGGQYSADADRERTRWLEERGYRVIRFWNNDVIDNIDGVLQRLAELLTD